jgi:hypothetical protein
MELKRLKRQFDKSASITPIDDVEAIVRRFIEYMNGMLKE